MIAWRRAWFGLAALLAAACAADPAPTPAPDCGSDASAGVHVPAADVICDKLSSYHLFAGPMAELRPADALVPYDLATPLFTDYALKYRMVYVPQGQKATISPDGVLEFPVGSMLVKTFAIARDLRQPEGERRIYETRLLIHRAEGWDVLPYIWNEQQTDATYAPIGATVAVEWTHYDGTPRHTDYGIPNRNQCKECHGYTAAGTRRKVLIPVGPKVKHLNKTYSYDSGSANQLEHWQELGILAGVTDTTAMPALADFANYALPLTDRVRAYLDANCAHCHNPEGAAAASGLLLAAEISDPLALGICKVPIRSIGDNSEFDIKPGEPDASGLINRITVTAGPDIMPRLGRTVVHAEAVEALRTWIATMSGSCTD